MGIKEFGCEGIGMIVEARLKLVQGIQDPVCLLSCLVGAQVGVRMAVQQCFGVNLIQPLGFAGRPLEAQDSGFLRNLLARAVVRREAQVEPKPHEQ